MMDLHGLKDFTLYHNKNFTDIQLFIFKKFFGSMHIKFGRNIVAWRSFYGFISWLDIGAKMENKQV